tara:strand:+ start:237 stop:827 length:591 start_codon:yes stop_codon:yes gene_type:complete
MSWDGFIDPVASFFGQDADTFAQEGKLKRGNNDNYKATAADRFWGRANDGQGALDTAEQTQTKKDYKVQYELATGKSWTPGMSATTAMTEIRDAKKKTKNTETVETATLLDGLPGGGKYQREQSDRRYYDSQQALLNERIDRRESENRKFEYQKLQDRKDDRRYNENLDRLDMKDRRMAISGMTGGLAALAAAFAM